MPSFGGMIESPPGMFVKGPVGTYTVSRSCVVWCASRSLCGLAFWGRPLADELLEIAAIVEAYPQQMAPSFDVVVDGRQVEALDGEALSVQMAWLWRHGAALLQRANIWSIVAEGTAVARLAQAMPALAGRFAFRVTTDAPAAFRAVAGEAGEALSRDVEAIAASARGLPREIHRVRALLARRLTIFAHLFPLRFIQFTVAILVILLEQLALARGRVPRRGGRGGGWVGGMH